MMKPTAFRSRNKDVELPNFEGVPHSETHSHGGGKYVKSMIYGGLDGIVSVFVTVASVSGASIPLGVILILGLAKLFAGSISMGVGDWLSTRAEVDFAKGERKREKWECDNFLEGEQKEMVELYTSKGLKEETAVKLVEILSKDKNRFIDIMMIEELGIMPDDESQIPWKHGVVNFSSFVIFGIVPLLAYALYVGIQSATGSKTSNTTITFIISIIVTLLTTFLMGFIKGGFTGTSRIKSGLLTTVLGGTAAFIGFIVSFGLQKGTGVSS